MSATVSRLFSVSLVIALAAAPAVAQDGAEAPATELERSTTASTAPQRARRAWLPPLRLRSIASVSDVAADPAAAGPGASDPRWFERGEEADAPADTRALWIERLVAPAIIPCATEPGGGIDCSATTTVVVAAVP